MSLSFEFQEQLRAIEESIQANQAENMNLSSEINDLQNEIREGYMPEKKPAPDYGEPWNEIQAMRVAIKEIYAEADAYADGASDASAHDKFCNEIAAKLKPFIKP